MSRSASPTARGAPRPRSGNSRSFLLVVLGVGVVVIVASGVYLVRSGESSDPLGGDEEDPAEEVVGGGTAENGGAGLPGGRRRTRAPKTEDGGDPDDEYDDSGVFLGAREIEGGVLVVDDASLRDVLQRKEWIEVRRQLDLLQNEGKPIPEDVVQALVDLLGNERWAVDARLALGAVKDEATGRKLADLAADPSTPEAVRVHALEALAKSGQPSALAGVRDLVAGPGADSAIGRAAMNALAGIGGPEGTKALLDAYFAHTGTPLSDQILSALGKCRDADRTLAERMREARTSGDPAALESMFRVGDYVRGNAGDELRRELRAIVESPIGLESLDGNPQERDRLRASAFATAAAMGGEALDAVIAKVHEGGDLRDTALGALAQARGDAAAEKIVALLRDQNDVNARVRIAKALGETGSRKGTETLHRLLDDPDGGVREYAAAALAQVRDPASVPVILARLDAVKGDRTVAIQHLRTLGAIAVKDALKKLNQLLESEDPFWVDQRPYLKRAISDIERGP